MIIEIMVSILVVLCVFFGASIASFLGVVTERQKRNESIMSPSRCVCGRKLKWFENIPILGWLIAQGTANCCGAKIPTRYITTEVLLGAAFGVGGTLLLVDNLLNLNAEPLSWIVLIATVEFLLICVAFTWNLLNESLKNSM